MAQDRPSLNPLLSWLWQMMTFFSTEEIKIPTGFHDQVYYVGEVLKSDTSGIVNSLLDFAINAALVDYVAETDQKNFTTLLNDWLGNINDDMRGKIPTGVTALAREYFRERWKRSSLIVLRTIWETRNGFVVPSKLWIVNGANIIVEDGNKDNRIIGTEKYYLKTKNNDTGKKPIPSMKNEKIFIQKPFSSWDSLYPIPFLIQRGLYKNMSLLNLMNTKGEKIIGKAIEYLFTTKKGTEALALSGNPNFIYSEEDLTKLKDSFKNFRDDNKTLAGTPTYFTNFDTEMEHLIPDYSKAMNSGLYAPIERRLLAGLGLIEVVEGVASTRREGILNPKPFIAEVKSGIADFVSLLTDVMKTIADENRIHRKYFSNQIEIHASTVDDFLDDSIKTHIRSMYDRGILSKQTYLEVVGAGYAEFEVEKKRRTNEYKEGMEDLFYPPVIQNVERDPDERNMNDDKDEDTKKDDVAPDEKDKTTEDKKGIEKINYKSNIEEIELYDGTDTEFLEAIEEFLGEFEESPYKRNSDLPKSVKKYSSKAQSIFRKAFNNALKYYKDETKAFKVAWSVLREYLNKK